MDYTHQLSRGTLQMEYSGCVVRHRDTGQFLVVQGLSDKRSNSEGLCLRVSEAGAVEDSQVDVNEADINLDKPNLGYYYHQGEDGKNTCLRLSAGIPAGSARYRRGLLHDIVHLGREDIWDTLLDPTYSPGSGDLWDMLRTATQQEATSVEELREGVANVLNASENQYVLSSTYLVIRNSRGYVDLKCEGEVVGTFREGERLYVESNNHATLLERVGIESYSSTD